MFPFDMPSVVGLLWYGQFLFDTLTHCDLVMPYDNIHIYSWTLVHATACCLAAPSNYLNWYWLLVSEIFWHWSDWQGTSTWPNNLYIRIGYIYRCHEFHWKINKYLPKLGWYSLILQWKSWQWTKWIKVTHTATERCLWGCFVLTKLLFNRKGKSHSYDTATKRLLHPIYQL